MATIGEPIAAALTSWAGSADTTSLPYYLATYNKWKSIEWTAKGATFDSSAFGGPANFTTNGASVLEIDVAMEAHLGTPQDGYLGLLTFAGGEVLNLDAYEINITRPLYNETPFGSQYKAFKTGLVSISGTIHGFIDAATAMKRPLLAAGWGSATFTVQASGTGKQLVAPINYRESKASLKRGSNAQKDYSWIASGAMTTVGSSSTILWAADADGSMLSNLNTANPPTITLTSNASLALAGTCYWKSISLSVKVGSPMMLKVGAMFSGTPSDLTALAS